MADDLSSVGTFLGKLDANIAKVPRDAGRDIGKMGRTVVLAEAVRIFGGDRKFSGARGSRKAKRVAGARYKVFGERVEIYPTGDPWYIFMKGRGRHPIRPWKKKALKLPSGGGWGPDDKGVRLAVLGGRLEPREDLLDPAEGMIRVRAPKIVSDALDVAIVRAIADG